MAAPEPRRALPEDLPEGLKPRLRLFLSVDLVGSTSFKQSRQAWRPEILSFYRNFDYILQHRYRAFIEEGGHDLPAPEFWKSNGDELLYACELQSLNHAHALMHVWIGALEEYRALHSGQSKYLDVKSTAWIGLFPTPNAEIFFRRGASQSEINDPVLAQSDLRDEWYSNPSAGQSITREFVGPSMDTGFRLTSWASPQRLIISVDLAFLLTGAYSRGVGPLKLHYSGQDKLKGVIDEQPYPTIWAPIGGGAALQGMHRGEVSTDRATIRAACEAVIELNYQSITPLYLAGAHHEDFDWAPPYILDRIRRNWDEEKRYRTEVTRVVVIE